MNDKNLVLIKSIFCKYINYKDYQIFLFGSRVKNTNQKYSDYDIGIKGKQPLSIDIRSRIENDLEESNLPYTVDIVDFYNASEKFDKLTDKIML